MSAMTDRTIAVKVAGRWATRAVAITAASMGR